MKRIAIDLNDVIRDYSNNFIRRYVENYNHEFDLDDFELSTNQLDLILPFKSDASYNNFVYDAYAFEIFGKCETCSRKTQSSLKELSNIVAQMEEETELMYVSSMEYGESIGYTYFFISKLGGVIRETYMPIYSTDIWNKCDILITANPILIDVKPEGKKVIKIDMPYNKGNEADYTFKNFEDFVNNITKVCGNEKSE